MDKDKNKESLNDMELIGTERLTEIYEIISEKAVENLKAEAVPSDETYRMITMSQGLFNQLNAQFGNYPRAPYWGSGLTGRCG